MLDTPVHRFMTTSVESIEATATLAHARDRMTARRCSALPVLDARGRPTGVITRSDLLRVGRAAGTEAATLRFDNRQVADAVTRRVWMVPAEASVAEAARTFLDEHIHRVFVESAGRLVGVLSGRDLMAAVAKRGLSIPISAVMSAPLHCIPARTGLGVAVDWLLQDHVSTVVVDEGDRHLGIFSRYQAIRLGDHAPSVAVGEVMQLGALTLPASTSAGEAAAKAIELNARQILVEDDGSLRRTEPAMGSRPRALDGVIGIVTSTDLAGAALMHEVPPGQAPV